LRITYTVPADGGRGWSVKRGHTSALHFDNQERALRAAENLAVAATAHGDRAVVKLVEREEVRFTKIFEPGWAPVRTII
jgi:hypothetical protein